MPNHRPSWRDDAENAGRGATPYEYVRFVRKATELALSWPCHDRDTLADLVQRLEALSEADQLRVWDLIEEWADSTPSDEAKASLRQRIRHLGKESIAHPERERAALAKLTPTDLVTRYAWLFTSHWVDLPPDDGGNEDFDYERHEHQLRELRLEALQEIRATLGFKGVRALANRSDANAGVVGYLVADVLPERCEAVRFAKSCLDPAASGTAARRETCLAGFLAKAAPDLVATLVDEVDRAFGRDTLLALLLCLPYGAATWRWLDDKPRAFRTTIGKRSDPGYGPITRKRRSTARSTSCLRQVAPGRLSGRFSWHGTKLRRRV